MQGLERWARLRVVTLTTCSATAALLIATGAQAAVITANNSATDLATALASTQNGLVTGASFASGPSSATATGVAGTGVGTFMPTDNTTFAVLTTGDVGNADPPNNSSSKGTDTSQQSSRGVNDLTVLKVDINVPTGHNCVGFDGVFYSEEFPEFVGSQFNDAFLAELDGNDWTYSSSTNTVTAAKNFAYDTNGKQLTVNTALGTTTETGLQYDGSTALLTARQQVTEGAHSIYFTVFDAGDSIYDTAVFLDGLRTANVPPAKCTAGATNADTDGDGLKDEWEESGFDSNDDGDTTDATDVDLPGMGANKDHKDLFVELDYMNPHQIANAELATITTMFGNAPVTNPDGTTGIRLHVDNGSTSVMNPVTGATWGDKSKSNSITHTNVIGQNIDTNGDGTTDTFSWTGAVAGGTDFDTAKSANFVAEREPIFRYSISVHRMGSSTDRTTGIARGIPGSDFLVSMGRTNGGVDGFCCPAGSRGGTFAHELGHTLGLRHGGADNLKWKPNYLSVMNYHFQFGGLQRTDGTTLYDYSRWDKNGTDSIADLDETALNESTGVVATGAPANFQTLRACQTTGDTAAAVGPFNMNTAVNWNCNAINNEGSVSKSINKDTATDTLASQNDWANIRFKAGAIGGLGLDANLPTQTEIVDDVPDTTLQNSTQALRGDTAKPTIKIATAKVRVKGGKIKLKITAKDAKALDNLTVKIDKGKVKQLTLTTFKNGKTVTRKNKTTFSLTIAVKPGRHTVRVIATDAVGNKATKKVARRFKKR